MPQFETTPLKPVDNIDVMNAIRNSASTAYQSRIPAATKANIQSTIANLMDWKPGRNEFIDGLINLVGLVIMPRQTWQNPLAKFKRGQLTYGDTIEEIMVGLAKAYVYEEKRDYLEKDIFGQEPNEVQSSFHKLNRKNYYKVTVNAVALRRAFQDPQGLNGLMNELLAQPVTSDNWDEYLTMASLFREYNEASGFFKVKVPDLLSGTSTAADAQAFLLAVRTMAEKLPFLDRKYNAAKMPVATTADKLELFLTPEASAKIDVQALSAAFNIDRAQIASRQTIIREEDMRIPGAQAILTTRDFFVVADTLFDTESIGNPVALTRNFFLHHHQIQSASRFVPAIVFSSTEETVTSITVSPVSGPATITLLDPSNALASTTTPARGKVYVVSNTTVSATNPTGGLNNGVTLTLSGNTSPRTVLTQTGILVVAPDEQAASFVITARSTDDPSYKSTLTLTPTGDLLTIWPNAGVDTNTATFTNTTAPRIQNTNKAKTGTVLTADPGQYDQEPDSYTYVWKRAGTAISGATSSTYTLASADIGQAVTVSVTPVKSGITGTATDSSNSVTITA